MSRELILHKLSIAFLFAAILSAASLFAFVQPVYAQQTTPTTVTAPSPNDLKELSRLLSDPAILQWLRANAENMVDNKPIAANGNATLRQQFAEGLARTRIRLMDLASAWQYLPNAPDTVVNIWKSQVSGAQTLRSITFALIFLFVGGALEWLFWQYFTPMRQRLEFTHYETLSGRVHSAFRRIVLIAAALAAFGLGSVGTFLTFDWPEFVQHIVLNFLIAVIVIRAILALARFSLSPHIPELRLVPLASQTARKLYRWISVVTAIAILGMTLSDTFAFLADFQQDKAQAHSASLAVSVVIAIIIAALMLFAVWRFSFGQLPTPTIEGQNSNKNRNLIPVLLGVLIVISLLLWLIGGQEMMWTLIIVSMVIPVTQLVSGLINHLFDEAEQVSPSNELLETDAINSPDSELPENNSEDDEDEEPTGGRYVLFRPVTVRLTRFVIIILALIVLGATWNISVLSLSESNSLAGRIFGVAVNVTVALLIADLIWVWAKTAIDRRLAESGMTGGAMMGGEGGGAVGPEARMATLLPILRKILLVTIIVMVGLSVLSAMGLNIAPLLAGAGVVGVAIGFGAQALVRDIVSGIFFLLDDAFRVGEYIEMENLRGTVESMSLRSLRVRHHRGAVHTIPFGELKSLTNYSRDWVIMKMEFRVPFETDIKLIKRLVKRVAANLQANEIYGKHFIQPLKSQGVRRMEEFNMVIGVKFMCAPGEQWVIRRDAYQQIRDIFTDNGIEMAQRNVKVEVIADRPLSEAEEKAVIGAGQEAAEQELPQAVQKDEP